ncbi:xanthine dehydrogenase accessory protein XdhC [Rhodoferax lacus]|uniref:xanthine dehydrogenase accessory protein XdhC n=1 Tax=Rhodoferax lacus TaxID=2184758 RepID=UPI001F386594|nr:xanthine dehydrogenase accessory protein XdhC [Rhodoferax lacus]
MLISVQSARGSVPREVGAWMAVFSKGVLGTIGGGRLEWDAIQHAQAMLVQAAQEPLADRTGVQQALFRLGPSLGQCCGGEVQLQFEYVTATDAAYLRTRLTPVQPGVALFGGGHVGHALVQVLSTLAMPIHWIDSRDEVFPQDVADTVHCEHSDPVQAAVPDLASGSRVLIMSFSHAEDLDIVMACLKRQRLHGDLPYVGLIGSKTKWATFRSRLRARGFTEPEMDHVTCPIGVSGIADKRPEAIAIAVAAQLLLLQKQA